MTDNEMKHKADLFKKFCAMSPDQLEAYEKKYEEAEKKAKDEEEKYRRCSSEYCDYNKVVEIAKKGRKQLFGKWYATKSGLGHHPTVFRVLKMTTGTEDEEFDILDVQGKPVLTPKQWFKSAKVYIYMFRFAPDFESAPDVYTKTSFEAGDLCALENFINELIKEIGVEHDWWKMSVEEFRKMLKENRESYVKDVDHRLMGDNIDTIKKLCNILGI